MESYWTQSLDADTMHALYLIVTSVCFTFILVIKRLVVDTKPFASDSSSGSFITDRHNWIHVHEEDQFTVMPPVPSNNESPHISGQSIYKTCPIHNSWIPESVGEHFQSLRRNSVLEYESESLHIGRNMSDMSLSSSVTNATLLTSHSGKLDDWPFDTEETYSHKDNKEFELIVGVNQARNLQAKSFDSSDPFCILSIENKEKKTMTIRKSTEPVWNERIHFRIEMNNPVLYVTVEHADFFCRAENKLGSVRIPLNGFQIERHYESWYSLGSGCGQINISIQLQALGREKVTKDSFTLRTVLGKGQFGKVLLVTRNDDLQEYAMKIYRKDIVLAQDKVKCVMAEKAILCEIKSPFLVELKYLFQTSSKLYFVMEYMAGGELFYYLKLYGRFTESQTRFYLAEIILGLQALHEYGIIYRDLKPEHIMMDAQGHIKLADFCLGKKLYKYERTGTLCGTPEYLAPEMLLGQKYDTSVDLWTLGILSYEFLTGEVPFRHNNANFMYKMILNDSPAIPSDLSPEASSLIAQLLEKQPAARMGCGRVGILEVKTHPFFRHTDWTMASNRSLEPPLVPGKIEKGHSTEDLRLIEDFQPRSSWEAPSSTFQSSSAQEFMLKYSCEQDGYLSGNENVCGSAEFGGLEFT